MKYIKITLMLIAIIFIVTPSVYCGQCRIQIYNIAGANVAYTLYDNTMQERPIDRGYVAYGVVVTRYLQTNSNVLRIEYKIQPLTPTGKRTRLKIYEVPCGALITLSLIHI